MGQIVHAVEEISGQCAEQGPDAHGQAVEDAVKDGQGQDVSGEHGAEGGKGEEEQGIPHEAQPEDPQNVQGVHQVGVGDDEALHPGGNGQHSQHGQDEEAQTGQILGGEQGLPLHGQGVEHAGGAVIIEVSEHRHGAQDAAHRQTHHSQGQDIHDLGGGAVEADGIGVDRLVQQIQGQQKGQQQGVGAPQGPEPGHGFPVKRGVKERGRGLHNPHLPIHK